MNPTAEPSRGRAPKPAVALSKLGGALPPIELKVRLAGEMAAAFADYQRAYQLTHGEAADPGALASQMVTAFIESDRGFVAWRKHNPDTGA